MLQKKRFTILSTYVCTLSLFAFLLTICVAKPANADQLSGAAQFCAPPTSVTAPDSIYALHFDTVTCPTCDYPSYRVLGGTMIVDSISVNGVKTGADSLLMEGVTISSALASVLNSQGTVTLSRLFEGSSPADTLIWNKFDEEWKVVPDVSMFYILDFDSTISVDTMLAGLETLDSLYNVLPMVLPELLACSTSVSVNDTKVGNQWYLDEIDNSSSKATRGNGGSSIKLAWGLIPEGLRGARIDAITGDTIPIKIAVIDVGVLDSAQIHDDLVNQVLWSKSQTPYLVEHAAGVAGIIAAETDNSYGVAGVAPNAEMIIYNAASGVGSADLYDAIVNENVGVVNVSLNIQWSDTIAFKVALAYSKAAGVTVVAAAGNLVDVGRTPKNFYPAAWNDYCIAIAGKAEGATSDPWDGLTGESAYGCPTCTPAVPAFVDFMAPAEGMYVLRDFDGYYKTADGTSYSAPIVTGLIALALGGNPDLSADDLIAGLENTAVSKSSFDALKYGHGMVDGYSFIREILGTVRQDNLDSMYAGFAIVDTAIEKCTGDPIAGAQVILAKGSEYVDTVTTDSNGVSVFWPNFPTTGTATFTATKSGHTTSVDSIDINRCSVSGDAEDNCSFGIGDNTFLIAWIFASGPDPAIPNNADSDRSCAITIGDVTYNIQTIFHGGPLPKLGCVDALTGFPKLNAANGVQSGSGEFTTSENVSVSTEIVSEGTSHLRINTPVNLTATDITLRILDGSPIQVNNLTDVPLHWSQDGEYARIGLVDAYGQKLIQAGDNAVLEIIGNVEVTNVLATAIQSNGTIAKLSPSVGPSTSSSAVLPVDFSFDQNYPNPFNPSTNFSFALPVSGRVSIEVFNILGQKVATVIDLEYEAGNHVVEWDGANSAGSKIASGVYFAKFISGDYSSKRKMVILK